MIQPNILVVDDDLSICQILCKILQREHYQVLEAHSVRSARQLFETNQVDAVLLDMMLPDGDGIELAKEMLLSNPEIPIVLISAHGTISKAVEATKRGIYDFVEKPFEKEQILLRLRNALAYGESRNELLHLKSSSLKHYNMIGNSPAMQTVYTLIDKIASTDLPVLILGENGVGKELVAHAIHTGSRRAKSKLVKLNCSAVPETLFESELFGHTRGAFTGAHVPRRGRIVDADKGTLFLDEIGDLSLQGQAKILRFLENGEVQKVGSNEIQMVDVRIIAATNKNLSKLVQDRLFRQDLYYRLEVFLIKVPPLRERKEDIPLFLDHFMAEYADKIGVDKPQLSQAAEHFLCGYDWKGNVRQLQHFVERLLLLVNSDLIDVHHIKALLQSRAEITESSQTLKQARLEFERNYILTVLRECKNNRTEAAKILGLDRANFYRKMQQVGINSQTVL